VPLAEHGRWDLPLADYEVLQVTFAFPIDIVIYGEGGEAGLIRLAGGFEFTQQRQGVGSFDASQQPWEELTPVLSLRHDRVRSARVSEPGNLVVEFESGRRMKAGSTPMYENWEISGPGFQLIALPTSGVALFRDGTV
jgi:hypothetical protein